MLVSRLRDLQRRRWPSEAMPLLLSLGTKSAAQPDLAALRTELCAALGVPAERLEVESAGGSLVRLML